MFCLLIPQIARLKWSKKKMTKMVLFVGIKIEFHLTKCNFHNFLRVELLITFVIQTVNDGMSGRNRNENNPQVTKGNQTNKCNHNHYFFLILFLLFSSELFFYFVKLFPFFSFCFLCSLSFTSLSSSCYIIILQH